MSTRSFALQVGLGDDGRVVALVGAAASGNATAWTEFLAEGRPLNWSTIGPVDVTSPSPPVVHGRIVLIADASKSGARVLMSRDGGRTWGVLSFHGTGAIPWGVAVGDVFVVGLDAGLLQTSTLAISTDAGGHWNEAKAPFPGRLGFRMACRPDGHCVAPEGRNIWRAERFGTTWSRANSTPIHEADSVFYAKDGTLFVVDRLGGTNGTDRLLASSDDGRTWRAIALP